MQQPSLSRLLPDTSIIFPNGILHIANRSIPDLAQQFGTPLYIFDRVTIINACTRYLQAFHVFYHASAIQILYASKAYLSPLIAQLIAEQGMGLDVVSGGELLVAQRASFPMERISFHGNNKSEDELRLALKLGVGRIVLDNWSELERLTRIARERAFAVERMSASPEEKVCIAGRYCESGDILIESVMLPRMHEGELLALPTAGAYCLPMASNYNLVPRPAVLLVDEQRVQVMERRETYDDRLIRYLNV